MPREHSHAVSDPLACVRAPPTCQTHVCTSHSVLKRSDILRASDRFRCPLPTAPDTETRRTCHATDITKAVQAACPECAIRPLMRPSARLLNFAKDSDLTTGVLPLPAVFLMVIPLSIRTSSDVLTRLLSIIGRAICSLVFHLRLGYDPMFVPSQSAQTSHVANSSEQFSPPSATVVPSIRALRSSFAHLHSRSPCRDLAAPTRTFTSGRIQDCCILVTGSSIGDDDGGEEADVNVDVGEEADVNVDVTEIPDVTVGAELADEGGFRDGVGSDGR
ncbi:hypothetical protein B0H21DRAFT_711966 [Amylocystis lapponica]|nr:hypothetical protein B0H21DRAFT_711966 [Amylocystis lapponica]